MSRRHLSSFNLSFLDIMFCGFGAVVLLVLIVNSQTVENRREQHQDLQAEVNRLQREVLAGEKLLVELHNSNQEVETEITQATGQSEIVIQQIKKTTEEIASFAKKSLAEKESIHKLQSDLKRLDAEQKRLLAQKQVNQNSGKNLRKFIGDGDRQYLTGLRLGGKRILLLVDSSASMLDTTIVNIIRQRNLSPEKQRQSAKWRQTVKTVEWLLANLPTATSIRIITFNDKTVPLGRSARKWTSITNADQVDKMLVALQKTVPAHGTSLHNAFAAAAKMSPKPDNILLLTDGLPTMAAKRSSKNTVSPKQRVQFFEQAVTRLPTGVPVNTILFPMEGDPMAAALFWRLAVDSKGSFLTPSSDWP